MLRSFHQQGINGLSRSCHSGSFGISGRSQGAQILSFGRHKIWLVQQFNSSFFSGFSRAVCGAYLGCALSFCKHSTWVFARVQRVRNAKDEWLKHVVSNVFPQLLGSWISFWKTPRVTDFPIAMVVMQMARCVHGTFFNISKIKFWFHLFHFDGMFILYFWASFFHIPDMHEANSLFSAESFPLIPWDFGHVACQIWICFLLSFDQVFPVYNVCFCSGCKVIVAFPIL